jgi:hypothetical protein
MYKRRCNLWAVIGLFLTLVQAICLGTCSAPAAAPGGRDARCVIGRLGVDCEDRYTLR